MAKKRNYENFELDHIMEWLRNPESTELSENEKQMYERLDYCYDQLKISSKKETAQKLVQRYGYTERTAYNDITRCIRLFNPINRRDLEWIRNFIVEDALLQIQVAREKFDMRAWQRARDTLLKIYQTDKADKAAIDPELLGRNEYYITVNFGQQAQKINMEELHKLPTEKRLKLTEFLFNDIEDIEEAKNIMES